MIRGRKILAGLIATALLICLMPVFVSGQGGFESWRSINMTGASNSYLTIGMDGVEDSYLTVNSVIVIPEITGIHVYPINCSFGLLRPNDIRATDPAFTLYNASNVTANVTIAVSGDWVGATGNWTHSDTCLPGVDTAGLLAIVEDGNGHTTVVVKKNEPYNYLATNLTPGSSVDFALEIYAPAEFSEYSVKENTIFITVSEG